MSTKNSNIIEPEIIDETGRVVSSVSPTKDHARPQGDTSGLLGGLLVLTVGFLTTVAVILFSVLILVPLMLMGRLLGLTFHTGRR